MTRTAVKRNGAIHISAGAGPRFGVVRFPGSNCDQDAYFAIRDVFGLPVEYLWHGDRDLKRSDVVILPGGFSYGDYLRTGAVARFAPIMDSVMAHAEKGGFVIGICNGFQVLCEAHLLPGALMRNAGLKFLGKFTTIRVENTDTPYTRDYRHGQLLQVPLAHGEGRYVCDASTLAELQASNRILFRYTDRHGLLTADGNPNGSTDCIAGIMNERRNIMGMMPHPERACEKILGSADGKPLFASVIAAARAML